MAQMTLSPVTDQDFAFAGQLDQLVGRSQHPWPDALGVALRAYSDDLGAPSVRALSLFSGAGGLDIGFHDAGVDVGEAVEVEPRFARTLEANTGSTGYLGNMAVHCVDIREFDAPRRATYELIIGGPPCQTFSAAGRRASGVQGTDDPRGRLFLEYVRILDELRPQAFVFENVYGIVGAQGGGAWRAICDSFAECGYQLHWRVLDAADYGAPQHRERLIIVGTRDAPFLFPRPTHGPDARTHVAHYTAGAAVAGAPRIGALPGPIAGRYGHLLAEIPPGLNYSFFTARMGHPEPVFAWRSKFSDFLYKADPEMPVRTIKAQGGQYTGPFSWESRPFSLAELKRLQTFPDRYEVVGARGAAIHQIGNSVPPQFARILALSLLEQVFDRPSPLALSYLMPDEPLGFRTRKRQLTPRYAAKARSALDAAPRPRARASKRGRPFSVTRAERFTDSTFRWAVDALPGATRVAVETELSDDQWSTHVAFSDDDLAIAPAFTVVAQPADESDWSLPVRRLAAAGSQRHPVLLFAAWRSLQQVVSEQAGVADLVQLNGYYQYRSGLDAALRIRGRPSKLWRVLSAVTAGHGVASTVPLPALEAAWGIPFARPGDALRVLHDMRGMGYEVRSHATNPQIPQGSFLVPYSFPTLAPDSVQLRKTL